MEQKEQKSNGEAKVDEKQFKYVDMPKYDPSKNYRWEPGTSFVLSGEEFGVILNSLRMILNTPEAQRILMAERANRAIENTLVRAVQAGIVQEVTSELPIKEVIKKE